MYVGAEAPTYYHQKKNTMNDFIFSNHIICPIIYTMYGAFYDPMKYEFIHVFEYGIYGNAIYALECDERRPIYSVALRHFSYIPL